MEITNVEELQRTAKELEDRIHRQRGQRLSATVLYNSSTNHLTGTLYPLRDDMARWIATLEDIEQGLSSRLESLEATAKAGPATVSANEEDGDPAGIYVRATANRQRYDRLVRDELPVLRANLAAVRKGPMGDSDIPQMLEERGIRKLDGQRHVYRGPGRVPLLRARSAFEALLGEITRVEGERDAAKATLDSLPS